MQARNYFLLLRLKSRRQAALGITEASFVLLSLALSFALRKLADFFKNK